jgi:hypothetical protein
MQEGEMSLLKSVFKRGQVASKSKFENLAESSVDALKRVEAECDWSDAALLFTDFSLEPRQSPEPPAHVG